MENKTIILTLLGLIALSFLLNAFIYFNSWQPVHATCYLDNEGNYDPSGQRIDFFGEQKVIDEIWDTEGEKIIMRNGVIKVQNKDIEVTGANKMWLWEECTKW